MKQQPARPMDALTLLARASSRRRRRPLLPWLLGLAGVVLLALVLWLWLWPGLGPTEVVLVAFDDVTVPGEQGRLATRIGPLYPEQEDRTLAHFAVFFLEPRSGIESRAWTDDDGLAAVAVDFPSPFDRPGRYVTRYSGEGRRRGAESQASLFVLAADRPLLLVDTDTVLTPPGSAPPDSPDVRAREGSVLALRELAQKQSVIYLSAAIDQPAQYAKRKAWLERAWTMPADRYPEGPLLARAAFPSKTENDSFLRDTLTRLRERFTGPIAAVSADASVAIQFDEAGMSPFWLAEAGTTTGRTERIASLQEMVKRLKDDAKPMP